MKFIMFVLTYLALLIVEGCIYSLFVFAMNDVSSTSPFFGCTDPYVSALIVFVICNIAASLSKQIVNEVLQDENN